MIEDIYDSWPEYDDGWYRVTVWVKNGTLVNEVGEETQMPTTEEYNKAWKDYWEYVWETGEDPLEEAYVKQFSYIKQYWEIEVSPSIVGIKILRMRRGRNGEWVMVVPQSMPKEVSDFFLLSGKDCKGGVGVYSRDEFKNMDDLIKQVKNTEGCTFRRKRKNSLHGIIGATVDVKIPVLDIIIADKIKKIAKREIKK